MNVWPDCTQTGFHYCHLIRIPQCSNRTRFISSNRKATRKHKTNSRWGPLLNFVSRTRYPGACHRTVATARLSHTEKSLHPSWDKPDTARGDHSTPAPAQHTCSLAVPVCSFHSSVIYRPWYSRFGKEKSHSNWVWFQAKNLAKAFQLLFKPGL